MRLYKLYLIMHGHTQDCTMELWKWHRVVENKDICYKHARTHARTHAHTHTHTHSTLSVVTEQRPPSLLQLLLPGRGGETVQGEWASPRAARRCERCSRETKSVMSREGGGPSGWRGWRENMNLQRTN